MNQDPGQDKFSSFQMLSVLFLELHLVLLQNLVIRIISEPAALALSDAFLLPSASSLALIKCLFYLVIPLRIILALPFARPFPNQELRPTSVQVFLYYYCGLLTFYRSLDVIIYNTIRR